MVYSRDIQGVTYTFGVSGMLLKNALIMFDYETKSLWPAMMNEAVRGEMKGTKLQVLPVVTKTTWGRWKKENPRTKVLSVSGVEHLSENVYAWRIASGKAGVVPLENVDGRLKPYDRVLGVEIGEGKTRAYPVAGVLRNGLIQEEMGERAIVVARTGAGEGLAAYDRTIDGETVRFAEALVDGRLEDQGGTSWDPRTGIALEGPQKGKQLRRLPGRDVFWYIWFDYHPETSLYP